MKMTQFQEMIDHVKKHVLNVRQIKAAELASECGISKERVYYV